MSCLPLRILVLAGSLSWATTYYVDHGASSSTGDGKSPSAPWKNLAQVQSAKLAPGDSVLFRRGSEWNGDSLALTSRHGGAAGLPTVFSSYGDTDAPEPHLTNSGRVLAVYRASHIVIERLHLSGARAGCLAIGDTGARDIVAQDLEADHCGIGVELDRARDAVVRRNFIHDLKMIRSTKGDSGTTAANDDYGAMGIVLSYADGCSIYRNHLVNCRDTSFDYGFDGGAVEAWGAVKHCDIYQNLAENTDGFMEFGGAPADTVRDVRIHHNLALESGSFSWIHVRDSGDKFGMNYDGLHIENNTAVTRKRMVRFFFGGGGKLANPEDIGIRNNILVADSLKGGMYYLPPFAHGNNLVWAPTNPFPKWSPGGPGDLWLDPKFVGPTDFSLQASSPAVDAGIQLGYATDYLGQSAWRGPTPDLGAFELQQGSTHSGILPRSRPMLVRYRDQYDVRGIRLKETRGLRALLAE